MKICVSDHHVYKRMKNTLRDMDSRCLEQFTRIWAVETWHCHVSMLVPRERFPAQIDVDQRTRLNMTLFRNKYRVESARMPHWDYSWPGWYFVTICTKDRKPYFGRITDGSMNLSALGVHANACWREIPSHHPGIEIDEFIVMPNHVHGIIVITGPERVPELRKRGEIRRVREISKVHPKGGALATVVGAFKSVVTYRCRTRNPEFGWQTRFHDRIIRGRNSLKAVRDYIRENPANWHKDPFFVP